MSAVWTLAGFFQWTGCVHLHRSVRSPPRRSGDQSRRTRRGHDIAVLIRVFLRGVLYSIEELAELSCGVPCKRAHGDKDVPACHHSLRHTNHQSPGHQAAETRLL